MEKAPRVAVVPVAMGWSDVGSWDALHAISEADGEGNVSRGDVITIDTANCLVRSEAGKRVALVGVRDLIVVAAGGGHFAVDAGTPGIEVRARPGLDPLRRQRGELAHRVFQSPSAGRRNQVHRCDRPAAGRGWRTGTGDRAGPAAGASGERTA